MTNGAFDTMRPPNIRWNLFVLMWREMGVYPLKMMKMVMVEISLAKEVVIKLNFRQMVKELEDVTTLMLPRYQTLSS